MTAIKICGVQNLETAEAAFAAGATYVGVVLAPGRRQVPLARAAQWTALLPGRLVAVVKDVPDATWDALWALPWGGLQVYDRPTATWVPEARSRGWLTVEPVATVGHPEADVWLWDSPVPGSGQTWTREGVDRPAHRLWVAGGLSPDNVRQVLERWQPDGVDVSSGVERRGEKAVDLIHAFIKEVRQWQSQPRRFPREVRRQPEAEDGDDTGATGGSLSQRP